MELIVGWLIFSLVVGAVASSKGRSGVGFFFLSILLSPIVGLIVALIVPRNGAMPVSVVNQPAPDPTAQIAALAGLRASGAISEGEYASKKDELLARL